jgi:hypothetical protein
MIPDLKTALAHLQWLTGQDNPEVAWQIFDDTKRRPDLARGFHGTLESVKERLIAAQLSGCGVFVSVNETNGRGRRKECMVAYRAAFLDLDNAPLPDSWPVKPGLVVSSSPGKHQVWWKLEPGTDFVRWQALARGLVERFSGDPKCTLTTQVGRCCGFWHLKDAPHLVTAI